MPKNKVPNPKKICDMNHNLGGPRGSCAAEIFEINQPKAKILIFEVGPKSDLSLHLKDQNETKMKRLGEV